MGALNSSKEGNKSGFKVVILFYLCVRIPMVYYNINSDVHCPTLFPVVLVRQLERQLERERDKSHTDFQQMENFYKQQLVQLEQQVSALSTDRNILMVNTISKPPE